MKRGRGQLGNRQGCHQVGNSASQPLALVPVTRLEADITLTAAYGDSPVGPAKTGPISQLGTFVERGTGGCQVS